MSVASKTPKRLYVSISSHGYGHIGQMAPILNKLMFERGDQIEITLQCGAREQFLKQTFHFDFKHIEKSDDIGMLMANSLDVQPQKSHRAYREYHERWPKEAMLKTREIDRQRADVVLSNVSYLTLAAGKQLNRPTLGLCSLNWADIYYSYCHLLPGSDEIYQKALSHYQEADRFLIPTPGMAMDSITNRVSIGPVARLGNHFPGFRRHLNLPESTQLVMVSMGGIPHKTEHQSWPVIENTVWIDASATSTSRADVIPLAQLPYQFIDVLRHCDLLISKPGYGLFTEASCNGVPLLYVKRDLWPEQPPLVKWLQQHNNCAELDREAFHAGNFELEVKSLLQASRSNPITPCSPLGVGDACGHILEALELR